MSDVKNVHETNLVSVAVKVDEASIKASTDAIVRILETAANNHTNDKVTLKALDAFKASATIEHCHFNGFSIVNDNSRRTEVNVQGDPNDVEAEVNGVKVDGQLNG